jgi:phosphatidylinositol 3-kinase
MATNESVIISSLTEQRSYDHLKWVSKVGSFYSSQDIHEPFRFRIATIDGFSPRDSCTELVASCSLHYLGSQLGETILTGPSHIRHSSPPPPAAAAFAKDRRTATVSVEVDEWICFPLRISDLPLDTLVCVTIRGYGGTVVGGTSFFPFTSRGQLKSGAKRYKIFRGVEADGSECSTTMGRRPLSAPERLWRDKCNGRIADVPWLDTLTAEKMTAVTAAGGDIGEDDDPDHEGSDEGAAEKSSDAAQSILLAIEFPFVANHNAVFFSSIPANFDRHAHHYDVMPSPVVPFYDMDLHVENLAEQKASVLSKSLYLVADVDAQPGPRERKLLREILRQAPISLDPAKPADEASLLWKYRYFLRNDVDGFIPFMQCVDWTVRTEVGEAEKLVPLWKAIAVEDALMCLSYLFASTHCIRKYAVDIIRREHPARIRSFLLQLVQGIRYDVERELADFVLELCYSSWEMCSDAYWFASVEAELEAASRNQTAGNAAGSQQTASAGSSAAASRAKGAGIYTEFLAQLVEGLRRHSSEFAHRIDKQVQLRQTLVTLFSTIFKDPRDRQKKMLFAKELIREEKCGIHELFAGQDEKVYLPSHPTLAARGMSSDSFYMFKSAKMPIAITFCMEERQQSTQTVESATTAGVVGGGEILSSTSQTLPKDAAVSRTPPTSPTTATALPPSDADPAYESEPPIARNETSVPLHDEEDCAKTAVESQAVEGAGVFDLPPPPPQNMLSIQHNDEDVVASPVSPTHLHLTPLNSSSAEPATLPAAAAAAGVKLENFDVIFKCGDDIRQDQLVIQVIQILDEMLKQNGLDLCLTPYTVLATSVDDGFVEKVANVETLQTVQRDMGGVVKYLQAKNPSPPDAHKRALQRFVKSCAGYCVITFLLGIGDRHLENLLITTDGRLLHIDFGYIFGNDPKPFPPPMKINREMVDAFGGVQSEGYASFKKYCCSAYNIIRKHAKLILSLLLLMVDASIPQIWDGKLDRRVNILKVQEKMRLELSDAEATQYIQNVIADSVGSVFTNLWDVIHVAAQAARH